jgi:hypothetical protein
MENVLEVLKKIIQENPESEIFIDNILSAELKDSNIHLKFPAFKELRTNLGNLSEKMSNIINPFRVNISFVEDYKEPFLPFTVMNSKYKNYILFIKMTEESFCGFIISKDKLLGSNLKKDFLEYKVKFNEFDDFKINDILKRLLHSMYFRLKDSWKYLHPVIFYNEKTKNYKLHKIFYEILDNLEEELSDVKRFIGKPFFTFYDLELYIEKKMERENED